MKLLTLRYCADCPHLAKSLEHGWECGAPLSTAKMPTFEKPMYIHEDCPLPDQEYEEEGQ